MLDVENIPCEINFVGSRRFILFHSNKNTWFFLRSTFAILQHNCFCPIRATPQTRHPSSGSVGHTDSRPIQLFRASVLTCSSVPCSERTVGPTNIKMADVDLAKTLGHLTAAAAGAAGSKDAAALSRELQKKTASVVSKVATTLKTSSSSKTR